MYRDNVVQDYAEPKEAMARTTRDQKYAVSKTAKTALCIYRDHVVHGYAEIKTLLSQ